MELLKTPHLPGAPRALNGSFVCHGHMCMCMTSSRVARPSAPALRS